MVNQEIVRQLIKELEAEKGCAVQLVADTPVSNRYSSSQMPNGREYFGRFEDRGVVVQRVSCLQEKYFHDVSMLEGEYHSFSQLEERAKELDILYSFPNSGSVVQRAFELVEQSVGGEFLCNNLACNFGSRVSRKSTELVLERNGILFFQYHIAVRPDGVYDDRTPHGTLSVIDETRVADITFKLIE